MLKNEWSKSNIQSTMRHKVLTADFFIRSTLTVAKELLGKLLIVKDKAITAGIIVETEAYLADDPACHAYQGKTPRCAPMFAAGGISYVYFIYGMYPMLNFVTEKPDIPGAVLIRAIEPVFGYDTMAQRRNFIKPVLWSSGPGRLTSALGITMGDNQLPLQGPRIYVCDVGLMPDEVQQTPRIGISKGQEPLWRFVWRVDRGNFPIRLSQNRT